ncbi:spore germination protein [Paenibacillus glycanilyticus]|uniref:spore germination protein n=1 Tax=Paenibacillus glycanilyticus TaxID=126569 RepID=UPI002040D6F7|nr:spore germination protein [Paenibacillus glycanilyticus]MCM3626537.1 spore germination protein [Paenibacillus glycanilyticus]
MQSSQHELTTIDEFLAACRQSSDFITIDLSFMLTAPTTFKLSYYKTLVDKAKLSHIIKSLQEVEPSASLTRIEELVAHIPIDGIQLTDEVETIQSGVLKGFLLVHNDKELHLNALVPLISKNGLRTSNETEEEFSVVGPKVGFVEDVDYNLQLVRLQLNSPDLIIKEITVGTLSKTRVSLLYLKEAANQENVAKIEKRIKSLNFDVIFDTTQLDQLIADNSFTPFPLFITTERRDRVVYSLILGQVAVVCDGSPYFITGPSNLFDFFVSPEDYYTPWLLGSFFRAIRIFGVVFSMLASAMYVAIITFHYDIIPKELLGRLVYSRQSVPFPPLVEALFLEITVEFLREAGARLPSRIGQTLGIVGGIILGQAAVEASLTSNVLIIIVSLSALASFVTPIYKMSNAIRFLRFPIIFLAAIWGSLGIALGVTIIIIHLSQLRSLGYPYTVPFFPLRTKDLKDSLVRSSYSKINSRPSFLKPATTIRYVPKKAKVKRDFDEE